MEHSHLPEKIWIGVPSLTNLLFSILKLLSAAVRSHRQTTHTQSAQNVPNLVHILLDIIDSTSNCDLNLRLKLQLLLSPKPNWNQTASLVTDCVPNHRPCTHSSSNPNQIQHPISMPAYTSCMPFNLNDRSSSNWGCRMTLWATWIEPRAVLIPAWRNLKFKLEFRNFRVRTGISDSHAPQSRCKCNSHSRAILG